MSEQVQESREMTLLEVRDWLRWQSVAIDRLAIANDKLARRVITAYRYFYDHQSDEQAQLELKAAVKDYMIRDHLDGERKDLGSKFGHKVDE